MPVWHRAALHDYLKIPMNKYPVLVAFAILLFAASCKKTNSATTPVPACPATLYGYIGPVAEDAVFTYGSIDQQAGTVKSITQFVGSPNSYSCVFNTLDNSYYILDNALDGEVRKLSLD